MESNDSNKNKDSEDITSKVAEKTDTKKPVRKRAKQYKKSAATVAKKKEKRGGRIAGTKNKNSAVFRKALDNCDINLAEKTLRAISAIKDPAKRAEMLIQLYPYVYPKLSDITQPIEYSNEIVDIIPADGMDLLKKV